MKILALIVVSFLLIACGAIPFSSYDGRNAGTVRKPDNKAELIDVLRPPDVSTVDGRFYLYSLDKTTDWHIVAFGVPGETWITTEKSARALYEFDLDNRVSDVAIHTCDAPGEDPVCDADQDTALWAMIETERGEEFVARYRQETASSRMYADAWQAAVLAGNLHELHTLLARGASIRLEHDDANALHHAAASGNVAMIEFLLARGLPIGSLDAFRAATPLHIAVQSGATDSVRYLLQRGADVNARDSEGNSPLHSAVSSDSVQLADLLIANGANVNARAADGRTPLFLAVSRNHLQSVELLLARGAEVDTHPDNDSTALAIAASSGAVDVLRLLLSHGAEPDDRGFFWNGDTPLILAVKANQLDAARILIDHGANVNKGSSWSMPLHDAVMRGNAEMVELLLANGADVNDKTRVHDNSKKYIPWRRVTPLAIAVENSDEAVASLLREAGGRL